MIMGFIDFLFGSFIFSLVIWVVGIPIKLMSNAIRAGLKNESLNEYNLDPSKALFWPISLAWEIGYYIRKRRERNER